MYNICNIFIKKKKDWSLMWNLLKILLVETYNLYPKVILWNHKILVACVKKIRQRRIHRK